MIQRMLMFVNKVENADHNECNISTTARIVLQMWTVLFNLS